jgi:hypothetical protein
MWKSPFMNIKDDVGKAETLYTHSFCLSSLAGKRVVGKVEEKRKGGEGGRGRRGERGRTEGGKNERINTSTIFSSLPPSPLLSSPFFCSFYILKYLFNFYSGMLFLGVTGMKAAVSHAPIDSNGRQKFVFFAFPHIGISDKGILGEVSIFSPLSPSLSILFPPLSPSPMEAKFSFFFPCSLPLIKAFWAYSLPSPLCSPLFFPLPLLSRSHSPLPLFILLLRLIAQDTPSLPRRAELSYSFGRNWLLIR